MTELVNNREAARRLGLSPRTLEHLRRGTSGPPFYKLGRRALYDPADLDAWVAKHRRTTLAQPVAATLAGEE